MIAKRVMRGKAGNFRKLGGYILNPQKLAGPASQPESSEWRRTTEYILDIAGGGKRSAAVRITNCASEDVEWAIREIEITQQMNQRARGDRTYHLVVSFPPGERPTAEQLIDIEDELCRSIGLRQHQRISAVHTDTEHLHIHVAINQVHPETYACIEPWYDKQKLMKACQRLELKHGLQRTNHGALAKQRTPPRADAMERHGGIQSLLGWMNQEVQPSIGQAIDEAKSWQDLHAVLAGYGLEIAPRGAGLIIKLVGGQARVTASSLHRRLSKAALTARFGTFAPPDPATRLPAKRTSYRRRPMHSGEDVDQLWAEYQRARSDALEARRHAVAAIGQETSRRLAALGDWHSHMRESIADDRGLTRLGKADRFGKLDLEFVVDKSAIEKKARERRKLARTDRRTPTWVTFLRNRVEAGNAAALSVLRRQEHKFERAVDARLGSSSDADVHEQIIQELKPEVRASGDTVYCLRDGGRLVTGANGIVLESISPFALTLFYRLHLAHSVVAPIRLTGSDEAKRLLVMTAAADATAVTFAVPELEAERRRLSKFVAGDANNQAALQYAVEYQATRFGTSHWSPCIVWEQAITGDVTIERLVTLRNGARAALLRPDDIVLVKPCNAEDVATAEQLIGQVVTVGHEGEIAAQTKRFWRRSR